MSATAGANIRPAASLLMLRDGPRGVEVLLMRRPVRGDNDFRSGVCVFPGGVLDAADAASRPWCLGLDDAGASARLGLPSGGLDYFIAAVRESFEEVGLLYVCQADGSSVDLLPHASLLRDWRQRLHAGRAQLAELCAAMDWRIDLRDTAYFAHWLTPVVRPKRFDTRFFVRMAPRDQLAMPDFGEALELLWLTPAEALQPQRGLKLLNVTRKVLLSIRDFASARAGYEFAQQLRPVRRIFPRQVWAADGALRFCIDGDPAYAEVALLDPEGRGHLRGELTPGDVQQLAEHLWRVAGARHNAYLVADGTRSTAAVIDADPVDELQMRSLRALATQAVGLLLFSDGADAEADAARRAALSTYWPQAASSHAGIGALQVGADVVLNALPGTSLTHAYALPADGIVIGGVSVDAAACTGLHWHAPHQGFLRPLHFI